MVDEPLNSLSGMHTLSLAVDVVEKLSNNSQQCNQQCDQQRDQQRDNQALNQELVQARKQIQSLSELLKQAQLLERKLTQKLLRIEMNMDKNIDVECEIINFKQKSNESLRSLERPCGRFDGFTPLGSSESKDVNPVRIEPLEQDQSSSSVQQKVEQQKVERWFQESQDSNGSLTVTRSNFSTIELEKLAAEIEDELEKPIDESESSVEIEDKQVSKKRKRSPHKQTPRIKAIDNIQIIDARESFNEPAIFECRYDKFENRRTCIRPYSIIGFMNPIDVIYNGENEGFWLVRRQYIENKKSSRQIVPKKSFPISACITNFVVRTDSHIIFNINDFTIFDAHEKKKRFPTEKKIYFFSAHEKYNTEYDLYEYSNNRGFLHGSINVCHRIMYKKLIGVS
jgi:hypothetical protein